MRIEKEVIDFEHLDLSQVEMSGEIIGLKTKEVLLVNAQQMETLKLMQYTNSIEGIVNYFLQKKVLILFSDFYNLLQFLIKEDLIKNRSFKAYLEIPKESAKSNILSQVKSIFGGEEPPPVEIEAEIRKIPFMRSLEPQVLDAFLSHMRVVDAPAGIAVCQQGQAQRSLFVLLKGQAAVIKRGNHPKPRRVATLSEGSVFGEVGFFLGEPRTADVVTETKCQVIRLKYQPDFFDKLIQKEPARQLQKRFWVIHALLKSEIFRSIPDDCFDALVFAGQVRTVSANEIICKQGDPGNHCYVVVQGSLVVSRDQQSIRVLKQGDCFGEMALMVSRGVRTATVQAQIESVLLEIPYDRFYQLLSQNLLLAIEFEKVAKQRILNDRVRDAI